APVAPGVRRSTSNLNDTRCTGTWLCHWWLTGYGLPSISRFRLSAWSQPYPSSRKRGRSHLSRVRVVPWSEAGTFREASRNAFQLPTQVFHARAAASFSRSPAFRWYESGVSPGRLGSPSTMRASRSTGSSRPDVWTVVKGFRTRVRTSSAPQPHTGPAVVFSVAPSGHRRGFVVASSVVPGRRPLVLRFLHLAPKGQRHASPGQSPGNWIGW